MNHLSTAQLATYLQVTKRTIQRRAIRESWSYITQTSLGGKRRMYEFASLPDFLRSSRACNTSGDTTPPGCPPLLKVFSIMLK